MRFNWGRRIKDEHKNPKILRTGIERFGFKLKPQERKKNYELNHAYFSTPASHWKERSEEMSSKFQQSREEEKIFRCETQKSNKR